MKTQITNKRPVRSYVIRSGRMTNSQRQAIDEYWEDNVVAYTGDLLDLECIFKNNLPVTLEIGFGMGASLIQMAVRDKGCNFLGVEVHRPGVGKTLHDANLKEIKNLKLICHDAQEVVQYSLADDSIDRILIFFPDPWPKKRHRKRRLIQTEFVKMIASKLKTNGSLHLATDWKEYAEYMMEVIEPLSEFRNAVAPNRYLEKSMRPKTKFENRGRKLGHSVWDLLYKKNTIS
jgi:tRNA (guanine-N7-)-methyltransferase